jgi:AcrR family transcriptional regulator
VTETRRVQIDDVATALFRERGYAATSVREIARALDLRGASLYAHVASKEDVLWSIVDQTAARFEDAADAAAGAEGSAEARLVGLLRTHVGVITGDPGAAVVFVHEWRQLNGHRRAEVLARRDRYEGRFRDLIRAGVDSGEFEPGDAGLIATFILSALNGIATWYRPDGRMSPEKIVETYADLALRAVRRRSPEEAP